MIGHHEAQEAQALLGDGPVPICDTVRAYLPLPFIAFGGPQAHIGLMLERFVIRKRWLSERLFTELLAISNALPGPASTQLAFTIALISAGPTAALLSFLVWSVPGAIFMGSCGYWIGRFGSQTIPVSILKIENGLSCVAVSLVAIAAMKLGSKILTSNSSRLIATGAACALILFPAEIWLIPVILASGGAIPLVFNRIRSSENDLPGASSPSKTDFDDIETFRESRVHLSYSNRAGAALLISTLSAVIVCYFIRTLPEANLYLRVFATFFIVGAIIFGGGPVVIPMLFSYVVTTGWMSSSEFLMGLAIINCMPGPNFNFAPFCGALALRGNPWSSAAGAFLGWLGIFLPGLTVKAGVLPFWATHRHLKHIEGLFEGFNSVAVGFMFAAVYMLWEKAIAVGPFGASLGSYPFFVVLTAISFVLVNYIKTPVPIVMVLAGVGSLVQSLFV